MANSVIAGVTDLCERFGNVIVVEDDLIVSPVFLNYLNTALVRYADEPKVMQISAHMFPVEIQAQADAIMLPFTTSWGWATWDRAWKHFDPSMSGLEKLKADRVLRRKFNLDGSYPYFRMLQRHAKGQNDSWAIRWYLSVFLQDGLVLFPRTSLVIHDGYDETATHATVRDQSTIKEVCTSRIIKYPEVVSDQEVLNKVTVFFRTERSFFKRLRRVMCVE